MRLKEWSCFKISMTKQINVGINAKVSYFINKEDACSNRDNVENLTEVETFEITGVENGEFKGAYNIRKDGQGVERQITENINIVTKKDVSGIDIYVKEKPLCCKLGVN